MIGVAVFFKQISFFCAAVSDLYFLDVLLGGFLKFTGGIKKKRKVGKRSKMKKSKE